MNQLVSYLFTYFRATRQVSDEEVQLPCPRCDHPNSYFNIRKRLGYCHRDSCHAIINLQELYDRCGVEPYPGWREDKPEKPRPLIKRVGSLGEVTLTPISLPPSTRPLLTQEAGNFVTPYPEVAQEVAKRVGGYKRVFRYSIGWDGQRVVIPVYWDGVIVQYLARAPWWKETSLHPKYLYYHDRSIQDYLFNWDEKKLAPHLSLVENTFNAIRWSDLGFTTNFGSNLSERQLSWILSSEVRSVALFWDEGAEGAAEKAANKLRSLGVRAIIVLLRGQPDSSYSDLEIADTCSKAHEQCLAGSRILVAR